jgi:SAM-dependent methyltransferase
LTIDRPEWVQKYVDGKTAPPLTKGLKYYFAVADHVLDRVTHPPRLETADDVIRCSKALVDYANLEKCAAVIGCGPKPESLRVLVRRGYRAVGIEPVESAVVEANNHLEGESTVHLGTAEYTGLPEASQSLILMENVLEHVDSVRKSLEEMYRILKPGGVLYILTTNRHRFSITGVNWEYSIRFFNLFPKSVRESYVYAQLHYSPWIARYSPRPAVHWFSFADLCAYGRDVGFAQFYCGADLKNHLNEHPGFVKKAVARLLKNPWLRAIHINMAPGEIFMWKRP